MSEPLTLPDVQSRPDARGIALDRVGITGLYYPLVIREKAGGRQPITARIDLLVGLHGSQRGAHLSGLVEAIERYRDQLFSMDDLIDLLRAVRRRQDEQGLAFERADVSIGFKYFVAKPAPATRIISLVAYDCGFEVQFNGGGTKSIRVTVPVTSVCPCSLEISDVGAHNQRAEVSLQLWQDLTDDRFIWLEDAISLVEECGSAAVHSVLKRADEKAVTEQMFRTPRFVEDIVREVVVRLRKTVPGIRYRVHCESFESIHAHNAYAEVSGAS